MTKLGALKIAEFEANFPYPPQLEQFFDKLDEKFLSLSSDFGYYKKAYDSSGAEIFQALNDIAFDPELRARALKEFGSSPINHFIYLQSMRCNQART